MSTEPSLEIPLATTIWERTPPEAQALLLEYMGTLRHLFSALSQQNEYIRLLTGQKFGPKSERSKPDITDADVSTSQAVQEPIGDGNTSEPAPAFPEKEEEQLTEPGARVPRGRKRFPEWLPRREVIHDLPAVQKVCTCGSEKCCIGKEEAERLGVIPAQLFVWHHIRLKYACAKCDGTPDQDTIEAPTSSTMPALPEEASCPALPATGVPTMPAIPAPSSTEEMNRQPVISIAPTPVQMIPKGIPSNGLLVYVIIAKVVDALPLYRQEAQFQRYGAVVRRATMCGWLIKVGQLLVPMMKALRVDLLTGPLIGCDETPFQVLDEPGREATTKSYMWVLLGGALDKPCVEFVYDRTRGADVPRQYLENYRGDVQADGYAGYSFLMTWTWIILIGCWTHVRRKFMEVIKARPIGLRSREGAADEAVKRIRAIYRIEREADLLKLSYDERRALRQEKAKPLVTSLKLWLEEIQPAVPPQCLLGKAISYALNQWPRLEHYLEEGYRRPDNNLVENLIRPFAVGRRNWLFSGTPEGATAMATFHSLVETAKMNGLEPSRYLRALFDRLPFATSPEDYRALLPQYIDRELLMTDLPEMTLFQPDT